MSPKQRVYQELLRSSVIHIRNLQSLPVWRRWRDESVYEEAELIHHLWHLLVEPEFGEPDVWFLNSQAAGYFQRAQRSPRYEQHIGLIRELFALVPDQLRRELEWSGPP